MKTAKPTMLLFVPVVPALFLVTSCTDNLASLGPTRIDSYSQGEWTCNRVFRVSGGDTLILSGTADLSIDMDRYRLSCHVDQQPNAPGFSYVVEQSGSYVKEEDTMRMMPEKGREWTCRWKDSYIGNMDISCRVLVISVGGDRLCLPLSRHPASSGEVDGDDWLVERFPGPLPYIADLRGDGTSRAYTLDIGGLYEFDTAGNPVWLIDVPRGLEAVVADCRGEGHGRLYLAGESKLLEVYYDGASWRCHRATTIAGKWLNTLTALDIRGEARQSLYYSTFDGLHEVRFEGGAWRESALAEAPNAGAYTRHPIFHGLVAGDLRGEGVTRGYSVVQYDDAGSRLDLIEYFVDADSLWQTAVIVSDLAGRGHGHFGGLAVLGREHGGPALHVAVTGTFLSVSWNQGSWVKTSTAPITGYGFAHGRGRNDAIVRGYTCRINAEFQECGLWEYTFDGGTWTNTSAVTGLYLGGGLVIGDGRGDGVIRVYAMGQSASETFEFTYKGG